MPHAPARIVNTTVVVAALGYFVDIYDLVLFSIVRVASLRTLGVPESELLERGVLLLNMQMAGMLIGGILWGVLGDKRGRVSVLFGSILLYSLANIANAFVPNVEMYALLRFIAGIGLAGELGAAITLVSEISAKETRGYSTSIVAGVGVMGAVFAALTAERFSWQTAYIVGGVLGLMLLFLRVRMFESGLYSQVKQKAAAAAATRLGDFRMLLASRERFGRYLCCIVVGLPIWYVIGILVTFSPEIARALGVQGEVSAGSAIMWAYLGLVVGDFGSGILSQWLGTRKKVIFAFLTATLALVLVYLLTPSRTPEWMYALCALMGCAVGYWAIFVTIGSELFGTNLRATVTTTVPNFVRGGVVLLTLAFQALKPGLGLVSAALVVGLAAFTAAYLALWRLEESFGKDLNFVEH